MLLELSIRNFAIIDDMSIRFHEGMTVLSGETGAGKSIIVNAVNLLLGSRASAVSIRTGSETAELEALFSLFPAAMEKAEHRFESKNANYKAIRSILQKSDLDEGDELMVRRIIARDGRNRVYINGRLSTMKLLGEIAEKLASISGQHAHQGLLDEDEHLAILDRFGGLWHLREKTGEAFRNLQPMMRQRNALCRKKEDLEKEKNQQEAEKEEIRSAAIEHNEDQTLTKELGRLKNAQTLYAAAHENLEKLYAKDNSISEQLGECANLLSKAASIDNELEPCGKRLESLIFQVQDIAEDLRAYLGKLEIDPGLIQEKEARLDQLKKLMRKYGPNLQDVLDHLERIERVFQEQEEIDGNIQALSREIEEQNNKLFDLAKMLSEKRRKAAAELSEKVMEKLSLLKMSHTRFEVCVLPLQNRESNDADKKADFVCETGMDEVFFRMAPGKEDALCPLAHIASGGELSRVVLALKVILSETDMVSSIIFDEVDAGIGGAVAEMVGQMLSSLAKTHQIICITHLPQIAKFADHHFHIEKTHVSGRAKTTIRQLGAEERIEEIARMLGGETLTEATLLHAKEMMELVNRQ